MRALKSVIEHPDMDLVGLYVYSEAKEGRDAGELCGIAPTGVLATRSLEDILATRPDCVLYMADRAEIDVLCRLLESGANVVTTRMEFHRPASLSPEDRKRIDDACQHGGTSIHSTGSSPGFITEALPLVLLSTERRLDCLTIDEFADMSTRNSPEMIFDLLGYGRAPSTFDPRTMEYLGHTFGDSLGAVADAISLPLDDVTVAAKAAVARNDVDVAAGTIEAGTIGALRMEVAGIRQEKPILRFRSTWYLTTDLEPAWDLRETGWRVLIEGDHPLDVGIRFPVPPEDWGEYSPGTTAHRPVNAVPYVCAAAPGIRTTADLPQIIPNLNRG